MSPLTLSWLEPFNGSLQLDDCLIKWRTGLLGLKAELKAERDFYQFEPGTNPKTDFWSLR